LSGGQHGGRAAGRVVSARKAEPDGTQVGPGRRSAVLVVSENFSQMMTFRCDAPEQLVALSKEWDSLQADADVMGYMGLRILASRDDPGRYVMISDFGVVDPDVSPAQEAFINNERPQTQEFADRFRAVVQGEPEWQHFDEIYNSRFR
jgi:hypothetical protein